jgi:hypothetical protein
VTQIKPEFQLQLIPYTALFCYEAMNYLNKKSELCIEQTSRYSMEEIRQKAKFFDLSINKLLQSVINVDEIQNDYFVQLMRFPELGKWNIHDNIGIFFDENKNIVGNSQYAYYVFQDEKMISKTNGEIIGYELQGEELRTFGFDLGKIIGNISSGLSSVGDFITGDFSINNFSVCNRDFNTNRCNVNGNDLYKPIRLFLLHVLSSIGFIIHILKKGIIRDSGLLLRLEYITYHYAIKRLKDIKAVCNEKQSFLGDNNLIETMNSINITDGQNLINSTFRNCMMHFGLKSKENMPLIEESKIDLSLPFCGLVETQFDGMDYYSYQSKIEAKLLSLAEILQQYLGFNALLSVD